MNEAVLYLGVILHAIGWAGVGYFLATKDTR